MDAGDERDWTPLRARFLKKKSQCDKKNPEKKRLPTASIFFLLFFFFLFPYFSFLVEGRQGIYQIRIGVDSLDSPEQKQLDYIHVTLFFLYLVILEVFCWCSLIYRR